MHKIRVREESKAYLILKRHGVVHGKKSHPTTTKRKLSGSSTVNVGHHVHWSITCRPVQQAVGNVAEM